MISHHCNVCKAYILGEREHELWCSQMRDWEKDRLGPERRLVEAMTHSIEAQSAANAAKYNLIAVMDDLGMQDLKSAIVPDG